RRQAPRSNQHRLPLRLTNALRFCTDFSFQAPGVAMRCRRPMSMTLSSGHRPPRRRAQTAILPGGAVVALALGTGIGVPPGVVGWAQGAIHSAGGASTGGTNNGCAYVTNAGSDTVSVMDTRTNRVMADVPVAPGPTGIAVTRNGRRVYVTHGGSGAPPVVSVI